MFLIILLFKANASGRLRWLLFNFTSHYWCILWGYQGRRENSWRKKKPIRLKCVTAQSGKSCEWSVREGVYIWGWWLIPSDYMLLLCNDGEHEGACAPVWVKRENEKKRGARRRSWCQQFTRKSHSSSLSACYKYGFLMCLFAVQFWQIQ